MAAMVADCPRCGAKQMTFEVSAAYPVHPRRYSWQYTFEAFSVCGKCHRSTTFIIKALPTPNPRAGRELEPIDFDKVSPTTRASLNDYFEIAGFLSLKDRVSAAPPEHVPAPIATIFREGATCCAVECWNAAGTMFRKCVDLATKPMLPEAETTGLNSKTRRDLGLRLKWLFDNRILPESLRELSSCIHQDGNDAAHSEFLTKDGAEELLDFTDVLLTRLYTEPRRLELAKERRDKRRAGPSEATA
ncbi:MAG: hypothetical protein NVS2B5_27510 [Beijerinckiaceae bacterium]